MSRAGVEPAPYDLQSYALPSSPRDAKASLETLLRSLAPDNPWLPLITATAITTLATLPLKATYAAIGVGPVPGLLSDMTASWERAGVASIT